ncbi:hypothetical protein EYF80_062918 [Liparis tanakae]|uniref:Uncharacterized protein n=1 Tax=Liparis tanakae TaxID=230148 RepID=A0A4Z2EDW3_9TELE|nr:hypothetical protein EYF80_062918 [Liparis tanakae]
MAVGCVTKRRVWEAGGELPSE